MDKKRTGQTTIEFVILFIIVIVALLAIQIYLKRGIQGRIKTQADQLGEQFAPRQTKTDMNIESFSNTLEETGTAAAGGDGMTKITVRNQWQNAWGSENVMNEEAEYWPR